MFTGWPSFNHIIDGFGMPLAMHCKVIGLYFTMVLSERPEDLIVGGTRFKEGKKEKRRKERKDRRREGGNKNHNQWNQILKNPDVRT